MRTFSHFLLVSSFFGVAVAPSVAAAQKDIDPPVPNVLLLIDTSGSMENMVDGSRAESSLTSKCSPGTATEMNRWAKLVQVMTGTIQGFSCYAQNRSSTAFQNEFSFLGEDPYDYKYYLPFHRILSNGCTAAPGVMPTNWYDWPAGAISYHAWDNPSAPCAVPWQQNQDGILDTFLDRVRFGLMTFDSLPDEGTGLAGSLLDGPSAVTGMWSYYDGWGGGGSPAKGKPPNCPTDRTMEVGARNPAAPPWEGRLIPFGDPDAPTATVKQTNTHVQEALIALRPYGATPLAGMMSDAREFLLNDPTVIPDNSQDPPVNKPFGPKADPYVVGGCRNTFIIVLSDGAPNLDLRDECATGDGQCPYPQPHEIAKELASLANPIKTFAVGFGLSSVGGTDCKSIVKADFLAGGKCEAPTGALKACCTLARIAIEGGTDKAHFADNEAALKMTLSQVLATISAKSTSRTLPVFASATGVQGNAKARSYQFLTSFRPAVGDGVWTGIIERKRYSCETGQAELEDVDVNLGDDFEKNLNKGAPERKFFTVIAEQYDGTKIHSMRSIRPHLLADDDLGKVNGTSTGLTDGALFALQFNSKPEALDMNPMTPPSACTTLLGTPGAGDCAESVIKWVVGEPGVPFSRNGSELGSIYHSTPAIDGPPGEFLRDESYAAFASAEAQVKRPLMLYTATTDGQLHAFKISANNTADSLQVDKEENNELWSFLPPHVLPRILPTYNQQAFLLDGAPVVKNVPMQRTVAQVQSGSATWKTVLLASGGAGGGFYYALDVTNPADPKFLWQLSEDKEGSPMFGSSVPTPAIATLALEDGTSIKEVAVAILPGGSAPLMPGTKDRAISAWPNVDSAYPPATTVRCWGDASCEAGAARSLTIVRLDTGELLMNFRGTVNDGPFAISNPKYKVVNFDSPITGTPVPYPSQTGQAANRIYVGDADGTLWRINLSSPKPTDWTAEIAWDAYALAGDAPAIRQPVETTPIVSVDPIGNAVLLFSTGDQQTFTTSTSVKTRVWSVLEKIEVDHYATEANWVVPLENGERVTGPMSLFNSVLYFSTFVPSSVGVCADGLSKVWGVNYLGSDTATPPGPAPEFIADLTDPSTKTLFEAQPVGSIIFGVAVTQTPSCYAVESYSDADLKSYTSVSDASEAKFQLVYHTGTGGEATEGAQTKSQTKELPPPPRSTRISSWAHIIE
jgi:type IV pilus assembly protein PilY1